jgi:hypothetical protein
MQRLKRRVMEGHEFGTQNIKPNISYNGSKNISNNVVGCCALPTMGMLKKG